MTRRTTKPAALPAFSNEDEEAKWWASAEGRRFLRERSSPGATSATKGSRLVSQLQRAKTVQIALRLPESDLAKARELAERKGLGYQTLIRMLVHEGLQREARRLAG